MLETVREYGLEQLTASGEEATIRDAHAAYFLAMAERAAMERIGTVQPQWLARLEADHSNLRATLAWLTEQGEIAAALRLAASCSWFWWYRGHYAEGRARLQALLGQSDAATHGRAWAAAMTEYGLLTHSQGDSARAVRLHEAAVAAWRRLAEPERLAEALYLYGIALMYIGDERAVPVSSEFLALAQTLSDQQWLGIALWALGRARYYQRDHDGAAEVLNEALVQVRDVWNPLATAYVLWTLGELAWDRGDKARALLLLRQAMARLWDLRETWSALLCLERLAVTSGRGHPQAAARLFGAAAAWRDAVGLRRPPVEKERYEQAVTVVRDVLGADAFAAVWAAGQSLTPEQAVAEVLDVGRG
jgi:tetratricopeptide (TPR) repeat protein